MVGLSIISPSTSTVCNTHYGNRRYNSPGTAGHDISETVSVGEEVGDALGHLVGVLNFSLAHYANSPPQRLPVTLGRLLLASPPRKM